MNTDLKGTASVGGRGKPGKGCPGGDLFRAISGYRPILKLWPALVKEMVSGTVGLTETREGCKGMAFAVTCMTTAAAGGDENWT